MNKHVAETITQTALTHEFAAQQACGYPLTRRARNAACASYPHLGGKHSDILVSWDTRSRNVEAFKAIQAELSLRRSGRRKAM